MQHIERQRGETLRPALDILDIAYSTRHRKSSDPRDKLFAIMGLVDQSDGSFLRPDYNMKVEEVFERLLGSIEVWNNMSESYPTFQTWARVSRNRGKEQRCLNMIVMGKGKVPVIKIYMFCNYFIILQNIETLP
jgi:hypothetical protein